MNYECELQEDYTGIMGNFQHLSPRSHLELDAARSSGGFARGTAEFLEDLSSQGLELWAEGNRLRYRAPREVLTPKLLNDTTCEQVLEVLMPT